MKIFLALMVAATALSTLRCYHCATGSETDTGCTVTGKVVSADRSVVAGASVTLHYQKEFSPAGLAKRNEPVRDGTTLTDEDGVFFFDSADTGRYLIEVIDRSTSGAVIPLEINATDRERSVEGTVLTLGSLIGSVDTAELHSAAGDSVYIPEINRSAPIDASGAFSFSGVPQWKYHLQLKNEASSIVPPPDTSALSVVSGDTVWVDNFGSAGQTVIPGTALINLLDSGLTVHYPFDGDAHDAGANGFDLDVVNAVLTKDRFGVADRAYYFNGSATMTATVTNVLSLSRFTLCVWIKGSGPGSYLPRLISVGKFGTIAEPYFALLYANGVYDHAPEVTKRLIFMTDRPSGNYDCTLHYSGGAVDTLVWRFAAVSFDAGRLRFYIDGQPDTDRMIVPDITQYEDSAVLNIGCSPSEDRYVGSLDDVRIYDRALSGIEIRALYLQQP